MSKYKGTTFTVNKPATEIADKFADLTKLSEVVDKLPQEERDKIGDVSFTTDSIAVNTNQMGEIKFVVSERTPQKITMKAQGTPVPLALDVALAAKGENTTEATCSVDIDIPMMLRPLVGPQIQKAVNMLSDVIAKVVG